MSTNLDQQAMTWCYEQWEFCFPDRFYLWCWIEDDEGGFWNLVNDNLVSTHLTSLKRIQEIENLFLSKVCLLETEEFYGRIYLDRLYNCKYLIQSLNYHRSIPFDIPRLW